MKSHRSLGVFAVFLIIVAMGLLSGWPPPNANAQEVQNTQVAPGLRVYLPLISNPVVPTETPRPTETPQPTQTPQPWSWLDALNGYRAMSQLPPLAEVPSWSTGAAKHARYMVENDVVGHTEVAGNPWFTPEGAVSARYSNLFASSDMSTSDEFALNAWVVTPFHAVGILDPHLQQTGFGSYRAAGPLYTMAAGLDVLRGRAELPSEIIFPVLWPGPGAVVPFRMFWSETPDPLTSCPGYATPAGLPIIIQVGPGNRTPHITAHSITRNGVSLEHCAFDETTYTNPDAAEQSVGRNVLDIRDAVVLIPRAPLDQWTEYSVSVTADGQTYRWSFTVGATP